MSEFWFSYASGECEYIWLFSLFTTSDTMGQQQMRDINSLESIMIVRSIGEFMWFVCDLNWPPIDGRNERGADL